ncbi:cytochrome P450 7B1 isoform X2 [Scyliorhinus canicula]|uniref:cytochrome P450 7B1 isoform X2 n=1 Tax=Scyliorhinus canicula TaxID=7830 RepID=UPI0018F4F963|nr:cytochrome P450 7B1 isoform X2 [Scyliorhinus canicula]
MVEMSLTVALVLAATVVLLLSCLMRRKRRLGEPPLEQGWIPLFGKAFEFHRDSSGFLVSCQQKWGDIFTVYIAGKYITFVLNPFLYQFVVQNKQLDFQEFSLAISARTFGHPYLNDAKVPVSSEEIQKQYSYLMGEELNNLVESAMKNLQSVLKQEQMGPTDWKVESMLDFCCRIIIETTYISLYGMAPQNEHKQITELREKFLKFDKMFPYLVAGIPIEFLGNTKMMRKELISYFTSRNLDQRLNMAKIIKERKNFLEGHSYLQDHQRAGSAIKESLRLCSFSMNIRTAQEDVTLTFKEEQRVKLRKGDWIALYPHILHMDPEVYENPEVYKYNRFVENGMEKTAFYKGGRKLRYYLMPFGSGSSMCPGRHFAVNEIKIFLSIILASFDVEIVEGEKSVGLANDRAGLGILFPDSDVQFRYKWHQ